jgi:hypothetical protein
MHLLTISVVHSDRPKYAYLKPQPVTEVATVYNPPYSGGAETGTICLLCIDKARAKYKTYI